MKYTNMYQALRKILDRDEQIDYAMSGKTAALIELWSRMYEGKAPWLDHITQDAGIPPAVAGEIARLTTLELQSRVEGSAKGSYIDRAYQGVIGKLRVETEYAFAKGGMVFKPYVTPAGLSVQYIQADAFFPLEYDSERITRCAFMDQFRRNNETYTRIELHSLKNRTLCIRNRAFVSRNDGVLGTEVSIGSVSKWSELVPEIQFSGVSKLPFGYFKIPLGNEKDARVGAALICFICLWLTFGKQPCEPWKCYGPDAGGCEHYYKISHGVSGLMPEKQITERHF